MSFTKEFKEFAMRGNVVDLAIGVIIGGAFGKIVGSLIDDVITPLLLKPALDAAHLSKWGKFQVLEQELNGFDRIYWLDVGLQHPGIFPWRYCVPFGDKSYHTGEGNLAWSDNETLQYNFTKLFNTQIFEKLNNICDDKIVTLVGGNAQTSYDFKQHGIIDYDIVKYFPIGGLIGGDTKQIKKYIEDYWDISNKVLDNNFLCTEESIMKVVYDNFDKNNVIDFSFDVHQTNEHDEFHFEMWNKGWNKPKPLYMVWYDILNY